MTAGDRLVALHAAAAAALLVAGLLGLDRSVAEALRASGVEGLRVFREGTFLLDTASGHLVSKYLPGWLACACGLILMLPRATRRGARGALFVGLTHLASVGLASLGKPLFGRLRPHELFTAGDWSQAWFAGGGGFPSGHAAFYFGLCLPLAWLLPRWGWPLLAAPWFVAAARVDANAHFVSDVAASLLIAAVTALVLARLTGAAAVAGGKTGGYVGA